VIEDFTHDDTRTLKLKYKDKEDSSGWNFESAKNSILTDLFYREQIQYRPFDYRFTVITKNSGGFIGRSRFDVMKHFLKPNVGLIIPRQTSQDYQHSFITNKIIDGNITASAKLFGTGCVFPLYLYPDENGQQSIDKLDIRTPNINLKLITEIALSLNLKFTNEKEQSKSTFAPIDILDYIYAVLHSPTYREKYNEFLKIDFPRVPYPTDAKKFWQLVKLGAELRQLHLLESDSKYITKYPIDGDNIVTKIKYDSNKVYINDAQYFDGVPSPVWEFFIGGYQPAQKWLKDRKERELNFDDILHYQKIIVALSETIHLMTEVDKVGVE
jgi:predicted helicase